MIKITSRKITKFTNVRTIKKIEEVRAAVVAFQAKTQEEILPSFQAAKYLTLINVGSIGLHSGRTFSFCDEKSIEVLM